jgi:serine/threonine-protein kinase
MDESPAAVIGPYRLIRHLGEGGMGQVWLAHDTRLEREVALKQLLPDAGPDAHARILHEGRAAARITHPNIAAVHDVIEHDGRMFIVMEYVEGETLADRLARGRLTATEVIDIARQLCDGLAAAHATGIIHRDLKPRNIQVTPSGVVKILDFGVARAVPMAAASAETVAGPIPGGAGGKTHFGNAGTVPYMSPENLHGRRVDARSDIFSLGVTLYELVVGRRAFSQQDAVARAAVITTLPPAAHVAEPSVPRWLSDVITKAMALRPDERYQSAKEIRAAIDTRTSQANARRRTVPTAAALIVAVIAVVIALWASGVIGGHPIRPTTIAVLPVEAADNVPASDFAARGIEALAVANLGAMPNIRVVSRAALAGKSRDDLAAIARDLHVNYAVDLHLNAATPQLQLSARVRGNNGADLWSSMLSGDQWNVERTLLDGFATAFRTADVWPRGLSEPDAAKLKRLPTTNPDALNEYTQARALLDRLDIPANVTRARDLLKSAVSRDPSFGLGYATLVTAYWMEYDRTKNPALLAPATDAAAAALRNSPDAGDTYIALAVVQSMSGRREEAVASLNRAIQLQPDNDEAYRTLALVLTDRGDFAGADAAARKAIAIRPRSWTLHNALGLAYYKAARYREAAEEFRVVTELEPSSPRGFQMAGAAMQQLGEIDQAIGNYEHAIRLGPSPNAYSNLALTYYQAGRFDEAARTFRQAADADPASAVLRRNLGDALVKAKHPAEAREAYGSCVALGNKTLTLNKADPPTIALIALCEAKLGQRAEALKHGKEALALAPTSRDVVYKNAAIAALLNDRDRALKLLEDAISRGVPPNGARDDDDLASLRTLPEFKRLTSATR